MSVPAKSQKVEAQAEKRTRVILGVGKDENERTERSVNGVLMHQTIYRAS